MAARTARGRVFAEEDRAHQPDGYGHNERDERDHERAVDQRQHAERLRDEQRRPACAGEEIDDRNVPEERQGLAEEGEDDAGRRQNRDCGANEQHTVDASLDEHAAAARRELRLNFRGARSAVHVLCDGCPAGEAPAKHTGQVFGHCRPNTPAGRLPHIRGYGSQRAASRVGRFRNARGNGVS